MSKDPSAEERKAVADARAAEAAAARAEEELAEWRSAQARRQRAAELEQKTTEAENSQLKALIPDFSKVTDHELKREGDEVMFASLLGHDALADAAHRVIAGIRQPLGLPEEPTSTNDRKSVRVLLTDDIDLATSDGTYAEIHAEFTRLQERSEQLIRQLPQGDTAAELADGGLAVGVATAIPGLLSLLSPKRSVKTAPFNPGATATITLVAGALLRIGADVAIDDFRMATEGDLAAMEAKLRDCRARLSLWRERELAKPPDDQDAGNLIACKATADAIDTALTAAHTVSEGAKRSPFSTAALREQLHGDEPQIHFVLFVGASAGSVIELVNDRPLILDDKFSVVATSALAYALLETKSKRLCAAGLEAGQAEMTGKIGEFIEPADRHPSKIRYKRTGSDTATPVD